MGGGDGSDAMLSPLAWHSPRHIHLHFIDNVHFSVYQLFSALISLRLVPFTFVLWSGFGMFVKVVSASGH